MINITRRFHDAVLKVANGISPGGAANLTSKVTVTVVNPTENDIAVSSGDYELKDGKLIASVRHMVKAGENEAIEYYLSAYTEYDNFYDGTGETVVYYHDDVYGRDALGTSYYSAESNFVNIDKNYKIIDPTKPASFTATLTTVD